MVTSFQEIVELWPSPDAMAAELGVRVEAVRKWRQRDRIPADLWAAIVDTPTARAARVTVVLMASIAARPAPAEPAPREPERAAS